MPIILKSVDSAGRPEKREFISCRILQERVIAIVAVSGRDACLSACWFPHGVQHLLLFRRPLDVEVGASAYVQMHWVWKGKATSLLQCRNEQILIYVVEWLHSLQAALAVQLPQSSPLSADYLYYLRPVSNTRGTA
jgi:hypothetical protein